MAAPQDWQKYNHAWSVNRAGPYGTWVGPELHKHMGVPLGLFARAATNPALGGIRIVVFQATLAALPRWIPVPLVPAIALVAVVVVAATACATFSFFPLPSTTITFPTTNQSIEKGHRHHHAVAPSFHRGGFGSRDDD